MSDTTAISWCDATFNPWWGCQKVSPACDHCYAERDAKRFAAGQVLWGVGSKRRTFDVATEAGMKHWRAPLVWAKTMPGKLGRRPRVFSASMGDWLDLDAPLDEFMRLLDTVRMTHELNWLLLTKRIGNWEKRLGQALNASNSIYLREWIALWLNGDAPRNVWLGITTVNQEEADRDVPKLLATPARVRFLSIEPMLGPIDLGGLWERPAYRGDTVSGFMDYEQLHWVIAGGESGPHARAAHPDWFRSLRDQCAVTDVPFHFKQWGEWAPHQPRAGGDEGGDLRRGHVRYLQGDGREPDGHFRKGDAAVARVGKAAAGRLLDGVEHNAFPS